MTASDSPEGGYTLVEMLVSLLVLSLAFFGLATATRVYSLTARATAVRTDRVSAERRLELALGQALGGGPYRGSAEYGASTLAGNEAGFHFDCATNLTCEARLDASTGQLMLTQSGRTRAVPLPGGPAVFAYLTADGRTEDHFPSAGSDRLTSLAVLSKGRPVAVVTLTKQQPDVCDFDTASGDCLRGADRTP